MEDQIKDQIIAEIHETVEKAFAKGAETERKRILEALPKEEGSVCSAHQTPVEFCRICGGTNGFNRCLEEIKQTLAMLQ